MVTTHECVSSSAPQPMSAGSVRAADGLTSRIDSVILARARETRALMVPTGTLQIDGRFLIGHALRAHEDQRLAKQRRERPEQALQIAEFGLGFLVSGCGVFDRSCPLERAAFGPATTGLLVEGVAENGEQPGFHVRALGELAESTKRANERILDKIVGRGAIPDQEPRETAQLRQYCRDLTMQGW